jgi:hypothetical protein
MLKKVLRDVASQSVLAWLLSLLTWGSMWMGYPAFYVVLLPVDAIIEYGILCSGRFFLAWSPSLSLEETLPLWAHILRLSGRGPWFLD